jgi:hypothetical protein
MNPQCLVSPQQKLCNQRKPVLEKPKCTRTHNGARCGGGTQLSHQPPHPLGKNWAWSKWGANFIKSIYTCLEAIACTLLEILHVHDCLHAIGRARASQQVCDLGDRHRKADSCCEANTCSTASSLGPVCFCSHGPHSGNLLYLHDTAIPSAMSASYGWSQEHRMISAYMRRRVTTNRASKQKGPASRNVGIRYSCIQGFEQRTRCATAVHCASRYVVLQCLRG